MTKEELKEKLIEANFELWHDDEFHCDTFMSKTAKVELNERTFEVSLQVYVDYYTVRITWWIESNKKVAKSYYVNSAIKEVESLNELLCAFLYECSVKYGVDLNKYEV